MLLEATKLILTSTLIQIAIVFGLFFVLGFIHSIIYKLTIRYFSHVFGWTGIIVTGVIGTPIHEISHWLMAKIFRHQIHSMSLFSPDRNSGKLGYVEHSYDRRSAYQSMGNFFIGSSPITFCSAALIALLYFFFENPTAIITPLITLPHTLHEFLQAWSTSFSNAWAQIDLGNWKFWVFFFLSLSIALHMAPSSYDQRTMWKGFFHISLLMLLINIILTLTKVPYTQFLLSHVTLLYTFAWVLVYATGVSLLFLILSFILYSVKRIFVR
ncbi:MAG TPA: hypothetical protein PK295_03600 [Candidatus Magasanikbacteria bacterium]|nr:hypothetical protein [Candidatus Magasanikbacteria bacterium]